MPPPPLKNVIIQGIMTVGILVSNAVAYGQGMGSGSTGRNNCSPTEIFGEKTPAPGVLEKYTHSCTDYPEQVYKWEISGALEVDGIATDENHFAVIEKKGQDIDIVWDGETPQGIIKIDPVHPIAQEAIKGGVLVVDLAKGGKCPKPELIFVSEGANDPCPGETHSYKFNYTYYDKDIPKKSSCWELVWRVKGVSQIKLNGGYNAMPEMYMTNDPYDPNNGKFCDHNYTSTEAVINIDDPSIITEIDKYDFAAVPYHNTCDGKNEFVTPYATIGDEIEVVFSELTSEAFIEVTGYSCGFDAGGGCGTKTAELEFEYIVSPVTLTGPSNLSCGACNVTYSVNGGDNSTSFDLSLPDGWTWTPIFPSLGGAQNALYQFNVCTNNHGGGDITVTLSNRCSSNSTTMPVSVSSPAQALTKPSNLKKSSSGTLCNNSTTVFSVDDMSSLNVISYTWDINTYDVLMNGQSTNQIITTVPYVEINFNNTQANNPLVRVRANYLCGSSSDWTGINVPLTHTPDAPSNFSYFGNACLGQMDVSFSEVYNADSYNWWVSDPSNFFLASATTAGNNPTNKLSANYTASAVTVYANAVNACGTSADGSISIVTNTEPSITPEIDLPSGIVCRDGNLTFKIKTSKIEEGANYLWQINNIIPSSGTTLSPLSMSGINLTEFTTNVGTNAPSQFDIKVRATDCLFQIERVSPTYTMYISYGSPFYCNTVPIKGVGNDLFSPNNPNNPNDGFFIELSPNPANNNIVVTMPENTDNEMANIKILDMLGNERKNVNTYNHIEHINVSDMPYGVYRVVVLRGDDLANKQLHIVR